MYSVTVRDHLMIAHSFRGEGFGPAQRLHGATYVVDVTFYRRTLDADDLVVDIALASQTVNQILSPLNYRNLDDEPAFQGRNTSTEMLAGAIHRRLAEAIANGALGPGGQGLARLSVTLSESHIAWASYTGELPA